MDKKASQFDLRLVQSGGQGGIPSHPQFLGSLEGKSYSGLVSDDQWATH